MSKVVPVDTMLELLLEIPGGWIVSIGKQNALRVTSPDGMRYAVLHCDGRPTVWYRYQQDPQYLIVACPVCAASAGKLCKSAKGNSTNLHAARREAAEKVEKAQLNGGKTA